MPSIETKIWLALKARASGLQALLDGMPINWPNSVLTSQPAEYMRVREVPNVPLRWALSGSAPHERLGLLQIMLYTKQNLDIAITKEKAGKIAAHFPADFRMTYDDVIVKVRMAPHVGASVPGDSHVETPVNVQYRCFA